MYAANERCFWKMILVILMSQLGTFAFAAYWLVTHPGDLQTAFMPSTTRPTRGRGNRRGAGSGAGVVAMRAISASKGERGLPWTDEDTKRAMTSRTAEMDAAALWARSMAGSALVGRLLEQAATTSPTA